MRSARALYYIFNWIFLFLSLVLSFRLVGLWHNTLDRNGSWISEKVAENFLNSPISLREEALHLGAWGGNQSVYTKKDFQIREGELKFTCKIAPDSHIDLYLRNSLGEKPLAIRLSRNSLMPSAFYRSSKSKEYQDEKKIEHYRTADKTAHSIKLLWDKDKTELWIDQTRFLSPFSVPEHFQLGFSGATKEEDQVDNVHLKAKGARNYLFYDNFTPQHTKLAITLVFSFFFIWIAASAFFSLEQRFYGSLGLTIFLFLALLVNEKLLLASYPKEISPPKNKVEANSFAK